MTSFGFRVKILKPLFYTKVFGIADLTGISRKKFSSHLVSLIKVEGLFSPYIVTHFDIVNSESLVQRYIYLKDS